MERTLFRYKIHPGDILRNTDFCNLPNPDEDLEDFLVMFLHNYQSDNRVAYLNDLFKLFNDEFINVSEKNRFIEIIGTKTEKEINEEIISVQNKLKNEAFENFYYLILNDKIELIPDEKK